MRLSDLQAQDILGQVKFDASGLIPAIVQDVASGQVLMLAYMNEESLRRSLASGRTWFYSRSRQRLWLKGQTSGNYQYIQDISYDCDADALLVKVRQEGVACHEGDYSCFHYPRTSEEHREWTLAEVVGELFHIIKERQASRPEGSYTSYLFNEGVDKIAKKIGEEATEVVIAAKGGEDQQITYEVADLIYHLLVLLANCGLGPDDISRELARRRK